MFKKYVICILALSAFLSGCDKSNNDQSQNLKIDAQANVQSVSQKEVNKEEKIGYLLSKHEKIFLDMQIEKIMKFPILMVLSYLTDLPKASSKEIADQYQANEVAADMKFKNKNLIIYGTVTSINSGLDDKPFVTLKGGNRMLEPQLRFNPKSLEKIAALTKGEELVFVCTGGGEMGSIPMLNACDFADDYISQKAIPLYKETVQAVLLNKNSGSNFEIAAFDTAIGAILLARELPEDSPCFKDGSMCKAEVAAIYKTVDTDYNNSIFVKKMPGLVKELLEKGVDVPAMFRK